MASEYRSTLPFRTIEDADPKARPLLEAAKAQFGIVPNMLAAMANEPGVLSTYQSGYAAFREEAGFSLAEQEVVFLTINVENHCTYCVAAHSIAADHMSKVPVEVTNAIREQKTIPDRKLASLSAFTTIMLRSRGRPSPRDVDHFLGAGFSER